ncbi:MAG TPA: NAD-dependent epimerase/dehydratase family protein, partial [Rhabdochlamydiaceae bacterium]|nr:NAD-dependent epimerase/dehydratase family protein [Rhabdochlamydiaceae bacterium]
MRVLVIGGTGFIGHHVADQLVGHGHEVAVVSRDPKRVQHPSYSRYRIILNDLVQMERWLPAELGCTDAVVYCTGATFRLGKPSPNFYFANVELTKRFFDLASRHPDIRTIYISSMSTLSGTKDPAIQHPLSILQSVKGKNHYDATKIMGEGIARNYAQKGMDVVIVHPGLAVGPRLDARSDLSSSEIILKFLNGKMPAFVESGHSFCDVRDVAKGIIAALEKGQRGKHYVLGGHNMTLSGFFESLCKCTGRRIPVKIPYRAALAISHLLQVLSCASFKTFKNPFPIGIAKSANLFYFADSHP